MDPEEPKRRLSIDQRRLLVVLVVILGMIAVLAIAVGWIAVGIGLPWWLAAIVAVAVAVSIGLFTILNLL